MVLAHRSGSVRKAVEKGLTMLTEFFCSIDMDLVVVMTSNYSVVIGHGYMVTRCPDVSSKTFPRSQEK